MSENITVSEEQDLLIQTESPVSMRETLFSGQTFKWRIIHENPPLYFSFIENHPVFIEQKEPTILSVFSLFENCSEIFFRQRITRFLSLDIDNAIVFEKTFRDRHPELWAMVNEF